MSTFEIIELVAIFGGQADSLFSYWISASFAVIISTYIGKDHLNFPITISISILYLMASMMFGVRFMAVASLTLHYLNLGAGALPPDFERFSLYLGLTRIPTFIVGFIITEIYLWHSYIKNQQADA